MRTGSIIILVIVTLFIGVSMGRAGEVVTVEKEIIKEVPVEKIVEVEKNGDKWRTLKEIDDDGFAIASSQMQLCSQGFQAIANLDTAEMNRVTLSMNQSVKVINELADRRNALLIELGY